jgi:hypothetical protein
MHYFFILFVRRHNSVRAGYHNGKALDFYSGVLGSTFSWDTGYPDLRFFVVLISYSIQILGQYLYNAKSFLVHYSPIILQSYVIVA